MKCIWIIPRIGCRSWRQERDKETKTGRSVRKQTWLGRHLLTWACWRQTDRQTDRLYPSQLHAQDKHSKCNVASLDTINVIPLFLYTPINMAKMKHLKCTIIYLMDYFGNTSNNRMKVKTPDDRLGTWNMDPPVFLRRIHCRDVAEYFTIKWANNKG